MAIYVMECSKILRADNILIYDKHSTVVLDLRCLTFTR